MLTSFHVTQYLHVFNHLSVTSAVVERQTKCLVDIKHGLLHVFIFFIQFVDWPVAFPWEINAVQLSSNWP